MNAILLAKGLIIGISIAAPVGPIGILCIRRTLAQGRLYGLVSGLGAASADALYGLIAGFGLNMVTAFLTGNRLWIQLIGGLFLCYMGIRTALSKAADAPPQSNGKHLLGAYASVFVLTLANPVTILAFMGIFAAMGLTQHHAGSALTLILGVFAGSAMWWMLLCMGVGFFRNKLNTKGLQIINIASGAIIGVFGIVTLSGVLDRWL